MRLIKNKKKFKKYAFYIEQSKVKRVRKYSFTSTKQNKRLCIP